VAGTQTAEAGIELAVAATATALAVKGDGGGLPGNLVDDLLNWLVRNATWLVLGGLGLGAILIALWMGFAIFRGSEAEKKK